ncbi:DedA family protein [Nesterenkonia ebinurensis]|uniref:DedA family protein n=1 Tax=Nesterenkonia ebinurensis TaxID=2608252 RepID=UPI00168BACA1|nr:VTT domain-containing protein [Nesterenkonia ebinurensis]
MDWLSELLTSSALPSWCLLLLLLVLMAIPLGPAEPTAVAAGVMISASALSPLPTVLIIAAGMTIGDVLTHQAGRPLLRALQQKPRAAQRIDFWSRALQHQPLGRDAAVAGLRFIPGARTPAALAARAAGVGGVRFMLLAVAGSLAWASLWVLGGEALVHLLPLEAVATILTSALCVWIIARHLRSRSCLRGEVSTVM